jgi:Ca2+-transporting ATPase
LNLAILWELVMLGLILYVPFLQRMFGTFGLTLQDLVIIGAVALTISPALELTKWMERRGWFGQID